MGRRLLVPMLLAACSPGVGRPPEFPDATARADAGFMDAEPPPDTGPRDAGFPDSEVFLPDAAPLPTSEFSGVFGILNATSPLFAREVGGAIALVVEDFPYVYMGTIADDGQIDASSIELLRRGCSVARMSGRYDRASATFNLLHETCNLAGDQLTSQIRGGFFDNFSPIRSGIYELEATVLGTGGCWQGPMTAMVRYAINYRTDDQIAVFTAEDLIAQPQWYRGRAADDRFTALDPTWSAQMTGAFSRQTANDPLVFTGQRDVYDGATACGFTISLTGARVELP